MTGDAPSAAAKIRAVARLRDLCRRLAHVPTATERRLVDRFQRLGRAPATALAEDVDALAAGWRAWWREQRTQDIAGMADALPPGLVGGLLMPRPVLSGESVADTPEPTQCLDSGTPNARGNRHGVASPTTESSGCALPLLTWPSAIG